MSTSWSRRWTVGALLLVLALGTSLGIGLTPASADQGMSRDRSFGLDGRVVVDPVAPSSPTGFEMVSQDDGGILVMGAIGSRYLRRYLSNGELDLGFGTDGTVELPADAAVYGTPLPANPTDSVVVRVAAEQQGRHLLHRYLHDGSRDMTFGIDGEVVVEFTESENPVGVAVAANRAVTIVAQRSTPQWELTTLERYHADGSPDLTFGDDGTARLTGIVAELIGVDALGATFLLGQGSILRVTPDGTLDLSYGVGGRAFLGGAEISLTDAFVADDGTVTTVSQRYTGERIARVQRFTSSGQPDTSFGDEGLTDLRFLSLQPLVSNATESVRPVTIEELHGGGIGVLVDSFGSTGAAVLRPDGTLDPDFGEEGRAILSVDLRVITGSFARSGAIEFLGWADNGPPVLLQRSIGGSPWPPTSPAPTDLVAVAGFSQSGARGITAWWSPVVNPDIEIVDRGYVVEMAHRDGTERVVTDETTVSLYGIPPGDYVVTVRSLNVYGEGHPATTTVSVPYPDLVALPKGGSFRAAVRLDCLGLGMRPRLDCPG